MKAMRQRLILDIIEEKAIETQEELAEELRARGIEVTQATVSRDIKELRLVKIPTGDGTYRYGLPRDSVIEHSEERMRRIFLDSVAHIDHCDNLIVIKTLPGTAQAVASTIDGAQWEEIMGTVAGDDTILVIVKPKEATEQVVTRFKEMMLG
ncbi:MAG: arginine repressor [Bacillota bacterium]